MRKCGRKKALAAAIRKSSDFEKVTEWKVENDNRKQPEDTNHSEYTLVADEYEEKNNQDYSDPG